MPGLPASLQTALADRYRIERELGAGSMATVYLAQDSRHDRKVALIWRSEQGGAPAPYLSLALHCYNGSVMVNNDGQRIVCNVTTSQPDAWMVDSMGSR